ncbi:MAG: ABC transporter permease [Nanoarchaeota archaeon]
MKVLKIIKKDLKLFARDKKNLILTIVAPALILFILGNVFSLSSTSKSFSGINLGLCNLDNNPIELDLPLFKIVKLSGNCESLAVKSVHNGKLRAAVVIPKNFTSDIENGEGTEIKIYIDNSKTQTSLVASDALKALVQELNEKIGTEFINKAWVRLNSLNERIKSILPSLEKAKESAIKTQQDLDEINNALDRVNDNRLDKTLYDLNQTLAYTDIDISNDLDSSVALLKNYSASCSFNSFECNKIRNMTSKLSVLSSRLRLRENALKNANISSLQEQVSLMQSSKNKLKADIIEINASAYEFTDNIITIENELRETSAALDVYTSRDPKSIIRAVSLDENFVFGNKTYFQFLAGGLILMLLLFTITLSSSTHLVYERNTGTLARTLLSPTSISTFIITKVIYFIMICAIELFVMFFISALFSSPLVFSLSVFSILVLASVNFILIGLVIGALSSTENTALLTSLVVGLPMFFLSGLFFPFEIMPKFMRVIGFNSPLTLASESLDKVIIYRSNINYNSLFELVFISVLLFFLLHYLIKRKPTNN